MIDSLAQQLVCIDCGAGYPLGYRLECDKCQGLLEFRYDLDRLRRHGRALFTGAGLWRYAPVLPIADPAHRVSLGEGETPLLECPRLAARLNVRRLLVKFEGANPTGTIKDRTSATAGAAALQVGVHATGVVCAGISAGANCWFEASTTDSFLLGHADPLPDGLGFLAGSFCPHYHGEPERRPRFHEYVADGRLPDGLACDDFAAVHFEGTELRAAVVSADGAGVYRIRRGGSGAVEEEHGRGGEAGRAYQSLTRVRGSPARRRIDTPGGPPYPPPHNVRGTRWRAHRSTCCRGRSTS